MEPSHFKKLGEMLIVAVAIGGFGTYLLSASIQFAICGPAAYRAVFGVIGGFTATLLMMFGMTMIVLPIFEKLRHSSVEKPWMRVGLFGLFYVVCIMVQVSALVSMWKYVPLPTEVDCSDRHGEDYSKS